MAQALDFWSNATFIYDLEIIKTYKAKVTLTVNLFDITPYKQIVKYYRPTFAFNESFAFWDAQVAATYSVQVMKITASVREQMRVLKYSLVDVMMSPTTKKLWPANFTEVNTDAVYNTGSSWTDRYWGALDILQFAGYDLNSNTYYGRNKPYYTYSLLHEDTNTHTGELLIYILQQLGIIA